LGWEGIVSQFLSDLEALLAPHLEPEQIELVDLSYQKEPGGWTLCLYLDKRGGITIDDCALWSSKIGDILETSGLIERSYVLEVSSPGIERPLRKGKDFVRFAGQMIHLKLYAAENGQKNYHGKLLGGSDQEIRFLSDDGRDLTFPTIKVAKCRLDPKIDF
jgi:ribosome maturation factor RimP